MSETSRSSTLSWTSLVLLSVVVAVLLCAVRLQFNAESYPWLFPDSFDWMVNGLRYSGAEGATFEISHRAMLLPLVHAGLLRLGAEDLIVLFGTLFHCLTPFVVYFFVQKTDSRAIAWWAAVLSLFSYTALGQSAYVGSDTAAHFFLVTTALALSAYSRTGTSRWFTWALLAGAAGVHAQYIGIIMAPALVLSLFLYDENGKMRCGLAQYAALIKSRSTYAALFLAAAFGVLFFLPRLLEFKVLYTERVQHGSLVRFHIEEPLLYLGGSISSFSWPIVLLALLGSVCGLRDPSTRRSTLFCLLWIADIVLFFTFLYSWKDVRFLLYVTVPVMVLAARGLVTVSSSAPFLGRVRRGAVYPFLLLLRGVLAAFVLFYASAPSTTDPFDYSFALTPWRSATFSKDSLVKLSPETPQIYFINHWYDGKREQANRSQISYDELRYSTPLRALLHDVRLSNYDLWRDHNFFFWTPSISRSEGYVVGNRTTLYARKEVRLVTSLDQLPAVLSSDNNLLIVRSADIAVLQERVIGFRDLSRLKAVVPEYAVIAGGSRAQIALAQLSRMPTFVAKVTAPEHADALFDGITRDPRNFSGAPLDSPIQIDFSETVSVNELRVALWDFDGRSYRFLVEGFQGAQWKVLGEWAGSGEIAVPLLGQQMSGLRLIGKDNSNLLQNPANRVFHVLELVIKTAP